MGYDMLIKLFMETTFQCFTDRTYRYWPVGVWQLFVVFLRMGARFASFQGLCENISHNWEIKTIEYRCAFLQQQWVN